MAVFWTVLAGLTLLIVAIAFILVVLGTRSLVRLDNVTAELDSPWPAVSIIVPAQRSARHRGGPEITATFRLRAT